MIGSSCLLFLAGFGSGVVACWVHFRRLRAKMVLMEFYLRSRIEAGLNHQSLSSKSCEPRQGRVA